MKIRRTVMRLCLPLIASSLLFITRIAIVDASISTSQSSTSLTSPPMVDGSGRKKKKKRRRRKQNDLLSTPPVSILQTAIEVEVEEDLDVITENNVDALQNKKEKGSSKTTARTKARKSRSKSTATTPTELESIATTSDRHAKGSSPNIKRKKKRRRKVISPSHEEEINNENGSSIERNEEVLLPINDDSTPEKDGKNLAKVGGGDDDTTTETETASDVERSNGTLKKKRRRRKAVTNNRNESTQNNEEKEMLLPIDEISLEVNDIDDGDSVQSTHLQSEETISREEVSMQSEAASESDGDESILSSTPSASDSITVTKNETTESMTIHDDTNEDAPATYEYTAHKEEETMEGIVRTDTGNANDDDETMSTTSGQGLAFVHSSSKYEHTQLSGGTTTTAGSGRGQTVTVKVSRQRREQRVHIIANPNEHSSTKKKKSSSLSKPKKSATKATTSARTSATNNNRSSSGKGGECLRRIKREWKDAVKMGIAYDWINMRTIHKDKSSSSSSSNNNDYVRIGPFGKNLLRWHFSVLGPSNSVYENGIYHGRVLLPKDYPGSPPRVQMLTPSGRFLCGADICLSASSYHPETWSPRWTVLSLVDALRLHMLTTANEIGGVMASSERREEYAGESRGWRCPGVVDHGGMVDDGIFPLCRGGVEEEEEPAAVADAKDVAEDGVSADESTNVMNIEGNSVPSESDEIHQHSTTAQSHDCLLNTDAVKGPPESTAEHHISRKKSTKAAKTKMQKRLHSNENEQQSQKSRTSSRSKSAKVAKVAIKKRSKTNANTTALRKDEASSNLDQEHPQGVLAILLKRITIEALKLPLRMLSIVLWILNGLESLLKSFVDGL